MDQKSDMVWKKPNLVSQLLARTRLCYWREETRQAQSWAPVENITSGEKYQLWLQQAVSVSRPTVALDLSLKALAFTRLGWLNHDNALATRGNSLYGRALQELQKALWDERMMWRDEILAAAYTLSVYELFETTSGSIKGWNSHLSGLGNLVRLRGPHRHQSSLGRAILESYRLSAMIQSIQFRQTSFHLEPAWSEGPWENQEKNPLQKLYDCGFKIGALQHRMDDAGLQKGDLGHEKARNYSKALSNCLVELDGWYQEFLSLSPSPLFWIGDQSSQSQLEQLTTNLLDSNDGPFPAPFKFPNLRIATTTISYWALKIVIAGTLRQLWNEILQPPRGSDDISSAESDSNNSQQSHYDRKPVPQNISSSDLQFNQGDHNSSSSQANPPGPSSMPNSLSGVIGPNNDPIALALNIVRTMPFCLSNEQGLLGAQQSLFPLRVALFILRLHPGTELRWCQTFYRAMNERKGLRYATEIAKMDGNHGTRGNERAAGVTPAVSPPPRPDSQPYALGVAKRGPEEAPSIN